MRRPPVPNPGDTNSLWTQYEWQLQTYGELRRTQPDALSVVAGILLYVNELHPTRSDLEQLKSEICAPEQPTFLPRPARQPTRLSRPGGLATRNSQVPFDYRLARALRVVPITPRPSRKRFSRLIPS